jgi:beta-glucosidase/6-phospho-beta-glucosidase/beta-galactosidase
MTGKSWRRTSVAGGAFGAVGACSNILAEIAHYKLPVCVTENGIADSADVNRSRFLGELFELGYALKRGLERGYVHGSRIDNFECNSGFCPRFGLVAFDTKTKTRKLRKSAETFSKRIQAAKVSQANIDALPNAAPTYCE